MSIHCDAEVRCTAFTARSATVTDLHQSQKVCVTDPNGNKYLPYAGGFQRGSFLANRDSPLVLVWLFPGTAGSPPERLAVPIPLKRGVPAVRGAGASRSQPASSVASNPIIEKMTGISFSTPSARRAS